MVEREKRAEIAAKVRPMPMAAATIPPIRGPTMDARARSPRVGKAYCLMSSGVGEKLGDDWRRR